MPKKTETAKMIVKKHWLYGDCKFNVDVFKEDHCYECIHEEVCKRDKENFCENYSFGTSEFKNCDGCLHRYTRFYGDLKERFLCFKCKHYCRKGLVI